MSANDKRSLSPALEPTAKRVRSESPEDDGTGFVPPGAENTANIEKDVQEGPTQNQNVNKSKALPTVQSTHERQSITEFDVGIKKFVNPSIPSLSAIIKHRFTDFMVFEVDKMGNICRLNDISKPALSETQQKEKDQEKELLTKNASEALTWTSSVESQLSEIFGKDFVHDKLEALVKSGPPTARNYNQQIHDYKQGIISEPIGEKSERSKAHQLIRDLFDSRLETGTNEDNSITIRWTKDGKSKRPRRSKAQSKENTDCPYIVFHLQKSNRDTHEALNFVAKQLRVRPNVLSIAGTKDKRGVTVQRICLKRGKRQLSIQETWNLVHGRNNTKRFPRAPYGVRIGDLSYSDQYIQLGDLSGNMFRILLREINKDNKENIVKALESVKEKGFINYYGMQRFGTMAVSTHEIGRAILKYDWVKVVNLILEPRSGDEEAVKVARQTWSINRDPAEAEKLFPYRYVAERCLLEYFKKRSGEEKHYATAIANIPKNLRMMYIHAYQSRIWNEAVSCRIEEFGFDLAPGDLVYDEKNIQDDIDDVEQEQDQQEDEKDNEDKETDGQENASAPNTFTKALPKVKILTQSDIDQGVYTIYDVILPTPGYLVTFPANKVSEKYTELLSQDGLTLENMKHTIKEFSCVGSYRKILSKPKNMTYSFKEYNDPDAPLCQTDEEIALNLELPKPESDKPNDRLAVQLEFILDTSTYATMALREVLKQETSSAAHTALSAAVE